MNEAIIEKLQKILRLANCKGATQGEIEAAMARAKAIAIQHNLDLAGIDWSQKDTKANPIKVDKKSIKCRSERPQRYHRFIYAVFRECFDVRTVTCWNTAFLIGEQVDVLICCELFPWLEDVFYSTYNRAANQGLIPRCAASKNGIYNGLYHGIVSANKREEAKLDQQQKQTMALVLVKKDDLIQQRMDKDFPDLQKARKSRIQISGTANAIGYQKGRTIRLTQVSSTGTARPAISS